MEHLIEDEPDGKNTCRVCQIIWRVMVLGALAIACGLMWKAFHIGS